MCIVRTTIRYLFIDLVAIKIASIAWFVEELKNLTHNVKIILSANVPMADFTRDEREKFNSVTHCHVCEKLFAPNDTRVRDHCQLTDTEVPRI